MTKLFLLITTLLCTVISGNIEPEPENPEIPNDLNPIPIRKEDPKFNRPRTPDYSSEISAYYQNGVIYLQFVENVGCMTVEVENLATGEQWYDNACSDNGTETISVSSAVGSYAITLTTDNGTIYTGEYSID